MSENRKTDKLIAEMMGWTSIIVDPSSQELIGQRSVSIQKVEIVPRFSTDISAAWEVMEKIKFLQPDPKDYGLKPGHLQLFTVQFNGFGWCVGWAPIGLDGNQTVEAEAETLPLAICLAALKAKEKS